MAHQIEVRSLDEDLLSEAATGRGRDMSGVAHELRDELTVICAYASLGGEVSYDAELTESYFARIESAGKRAAHISEQLLVVDPAGPSGDCHTKAVTWPAALDQRHPETDRAPVSSFRRRLGLKP